MLAQSAQFSSVCCWWWWWWLIVIIVDVNSIKTVNVFNIKSIPRCVYWLFTHKYTCTHCVLVRRQLIIWHILSQKLCLLMWKYENWIDIEMRTLNLFMRKVKWNCRMHASVVKFITWMCCVVRRWLAIEFIFPFVSSCYSMRKCSG